MCRSYHCSVGGAPKALSKGRGLDAKRYRNEKADFSKAGSKEKDEKHDHPKDEEHFDDKNAFM